MATDEDIEAARTAWWADWWKADYSWNGLAAKPWRGWLVDSEGRLVRRGGRSGNVASDARPANLQDFWRAEENYLIQDPEFPDRSWTRAHVPSHWQSGAPAKARWSQDALFEISHALETAIGRLPDHAFERDPAQRTTRRRQLLTRLSGFASYWPVPLDGAVLPSVPQFLKDHEYLQGKDTAFFGELDLPNNGASIDFRNCLINGPAYLEGDEGDAGDVRFTRSVFLSYLSLESANMRSIQCLGAKFFAGVDFDSASVRERADFVNAEFHESATFADFSAKTLSFRRSKFFKDVTFKSSRCNEAHFERAKLRDLSDFEGIIFEEAIFDRCEFDEDSIFRKAHIGKARFRRAKWRARADFRSFRTADCDFDSAMFADSARFGNAIFEGPMRFNNTCFSGPALFAGITWPSDLRHFQRAFMEARFERHANFQSTEFWAFSAFDGASFESEVRFNATAISGDAAFNTAVRHAGNAGSQISLGHGLRALRRAAENTRDRVSEQKYHRYELIVRKLLSAKWSGERFISTIYGSVAAYGYSVSRPILTAIGLWVICSALYFSIGVAMRLPAADSIYLCTCAPLHNGGLEAAQLSGRSMFNLFGIWNARPIEVDKDGLEHGLLWADEFWGLVVRLLSSLQSAISGVLIFLVGLAVRRRYQIA